jgi:hypothetical protein
MSSTIITRREYGKHGFIKVTSRRQTVANYRNQNGFAGVNYSNRYE